MPKQQSKSIREPRESAAFVCVSPTVMPLDSAIPPIEQAAAFLKVYSVTLRRKATLLLAFLPLLLGDDLASILGLTTDRIRSHTRKILSFQRLDDCSSQSDKTGAKQ